MNNKEQIIIDGVNVNDCQEYHEGHCETYTLCTGTNCYFKQLVRKTQECEQKDERIIELTKETLSLKQECEELISEKDFYLQKIETLEDKCEELKDKIKKLRKKLALEIEANDRYREVLEEIKTVTKINCEEICGKNYDTCKDRDCLRYK